MPERANRLRPAIDASAAEGIAGRTGFLPRRLALLAAVGGLLSLLLTGALWQGWLGQRSSAPVAAGSAATRLARLSHTGLQSGLSSLPASALGPVSQAIGAADPRYRIKPSAGGLAASNPAQRLAERFDSSGLAVSWRSARLRLSPPAMGYGSARQAPAAVAPSARANRVSFAQAGLSEWYANGPLGLEQGFTIARAPAGPEAGPLTLAMTLSGNAHAALAAGHQSVTLSAAGAPALHYGHLVARDANGRSLPSWLALARGRLLLRVDARGARYPLRIDPFIQQGEKLTGAGETGGPFFVGGLFGFDVALSADGNTALIGGPFDGEGVGAAWVFTRSGSTWTQQGEKLTAKSGEEAGTALFGAAVALSADGNTALIGGPFDGEGVGAAWVFTRSGSTWTQQGEKLTAKSGEETEGRFGESVALSADGNTALIGGFSDHEGKGAAWTFTRSGSTWSQEGEKLTPKSGEEIGPGQFGGSVALSSDGQSALIGAGSDHGGLGAAWAFSRSDSGWTQEGEKITPKSGEEVGPGNFGQSVALAGEGGTALIGAPADNSNAGAAWAFSQSDPGWTQEGEKITPKSGEEVGLGNFGQSVALSAAGRSALIGAGSDNGGFGAAWAFSRSDAGWIQEGEKLTPKSGEQVGEGAFGNSVALSSDGRTGLIGAFFDAGGTGAAWAFVNPPPPPPTGTVALASPTIAVGRHGKAAVMLTCTGTAPSCVAKLTLSVQGTIGPSDWEHDHSGTVVIGRRAASLPSGETTTVKLQLNHRGRELLDAANGRLAATLTILKYRPKPREEQTDPVELVQQAPEQSWSEHSWSGD
jgi:hypothetical protein